MDREYDRPSFARLVGETLPSCRGALLLLLTNFVLRASTLIHKFVNIDEPIYGEFVLSMLDGNPPYTAMIGEKPLLNYLFYYVCQRLFGAFDLGCVHVATILWVTATAIAIYMILRLYLSEKYALSGALIFSLLTTLGDFKMISADGETLMNMPLCLSAFAFLAALRLERKWLYVLAGLFIGIGTHFRYHGGIQLAVVGTYLMVYRPFFARRRQGIASQMVGGLWRLSLVVAGFILLTIVMFAWLWLWGSWDDYVFWTFEYELQYVKAGIETIDAVSKGIRRTLIIAAIGFVVWFSAFETISKWLIRRLGEEGSRARELIAYAALWLLWGFIAVCVGGRFPMRYYTQIYPALGLLAALSMPPRWYMSERLQGWRRAWKRWALIIPVMVLWVLRFFSPWILDALGQYDYSPFQKEIARYVRSNTEADDRIYIWGWGAGIHFYAERYPATRFIHSDFLTGRIAGSPTAYDPDYDTSFNIVPGSWEMFIKDLRESRPAYIIDTSTANIHDYVKYPIEKFPLLDEYVDRHYVLETTIHGVDIYRRVD